MFLVIHFPKFITYPFVFLNNCNFNRQNCTIFVAKSVGFLSDYIYLTFLYHHVTFFLNVAYQQTLTNVYLFKDWSSLSSGYNTPPGILRMTDDQRIRKGESVEIACLVVGVPDPVISWYLNGERYLIYSNSRTSEGLLSTVYIHSLHSTSYIICRGANLMGVTEQSTRILVEGESCNIFRKTLRNF